MLYAQPACQSQIRVELRRIEWDAMKHVLIRLLSIAFVVAPNGCTTLPDYTYDGGQTGGASSTPEKTGQDPQLTKANAEKPWYTIAGTLALISALAAALSPHTPDPKPDGIEDSVSRE